VSSFPPSGHSLIPSISNLTNGPLLPSIVNSSHIGLAGPTTAATAAATAALLSSAPASGVMSDSEDDRLPIPNTSAVSTSRSLPQDRAHFLAELEAFGGGHYSATGEFRHKSHLPNSRKVLEAIDLAFQQVNLPGYNVSSAEDTTHGAPLPANGLKGLINTMNNDWLDRQHAVIQIRGIDYDYARNMIDSKYITNGSSSSQAYPALLRRMSTTSFRPPVNGKYDYDYDAILARVYY
jgi:hypothetical protein